MSAPKVCDNSVMSPRSASRIGLAPARAASSPSKGTIGLMQMRSFTPAFSATEACSVFFIAPST
jgi:hypothetical protein